jgi:hypothetical protein
MERLEASEHSVGGKIREMSKQVSGVGFQAASSNFELGTRT